MRDSILVELDKSQTNDFFVKYEHLGNVGLGVWHWGLVFNDVLASAVTFGTTCFASKRCFISQVSRKYGAKVIQLCRGATAPWAPKNTPSRTISLSLRELGLRFERTIVVAYADPSFHEVGTIYQASNAIFTGWTEPKGQANYVINGQKLSGWLVRKRFGTRSKKKLREIDKNMIVMPLNRKLRYIFIAAPDNIRRKIKKDFCSFELPYPKRKDYKIPHMDITKLVKKKRNKSFQQQLSAVF